MTDFIITKTDFKFAKTISIFAKTNSSFAKVIFIQTTVLFIIAKDITYKKVIIIFPEAIAVNVQKNNSDSKLWLNYKG